MQRFLMDVYPIPLPRQMSDVAVAAGFLLLSAGAFSMPAHAATCGAADYVNPPMCLVRGTIISGLSDPTVYSHWARNHCNFDIEIIWLVDDQDASRRHVMKPKAHWEELVKKKASVQLVCCPNAGKCE